MTEFASPRCPVCGAAIYHPKAVQLSARASQGKWSPEAPFAVGFQCANEDCSALLPLTARSSTDEPITIFGG